MIIFAIFDGRAPAFPFLVLICILLRFLYRVIFLIMEWVGVLSQIVSPSKFNCYLDTTPIC